MKVVSASAPLPVSTTEIAEISLDEYSALAAWCVNIKSSDEIKRGHEKLALA